MPLPSNNLYAYCFWCLGIFINKFDSTTETKSFCLLSWQSYIGFCQTQPRHELFSTLLALLAMSVGQNQEVSPTSPPHRNKAKNCRVSSSEKSSNGPHFDPFQGKNENCSSFVTMISTSRASFFVNLTTFKQRSGLNKFYPLNIRILKMGWLSKF